MFRVKQSVKSDTVNFVSNVKIIKTDGVKKHSRKIEFVKSLNKLRKKARIADLKSMINDYSSDMRIENIVNGDVEDVVLEKYNLLHEKVWRLENEN